MSAQIDYFFSLISPFAYLGHDAFMRVAQKHGAEVHFRPFNLFEVFKSSGAVPVPQRPPSRQAYRMIELQRVAHFRGLPINPMPRHWPVSPDLANASAWAIGANGDDPSGFVLATLTACWAQERDISDRDTLAAILGDTGANADDVLGRADSDEARAALAANTEAAIAMGAVGAPVYVLAGEPFWGQDRIEYLDHALTTGRAPFRPS